MQVWIDWPRSTFLFSEHNYASLESLLAVYPRAQVVASVVAPGMAANFRYANANSFVQFERYRKLGFDVSTRLVNAGASLYAGNAPGRTWWAEHRRTCCPRYVDFAAYFAKDDKDVVPTAAVTLFLRFQALWMRGGLFADLTVVWLQGATQRGFEIGCDNRTMVLLFPEPRDAAVTCVLRRFDACSGNSSCADALAANVKAVLTACYGPAPNSLAGRVRWFDCDAPPALFEQESGSLVDEDVESVAVWLGNDAASGEWRVPERGSLVARLYRRHLVPLAVADTKCADWLRARNASFCDSFRNALVGPASTPTPVEVAVAARTCSPRIFIPAAQKGASSALFDLLMTHPQTLRPLRGSHYKEPGAYTGQVYARQRLAKRVSRFPFVRPSEGLVSVDATVTYATESWLPALRAAFDAPRARVVFALREPVDRSFSDYRFCYTPYFESQDLGWDAAVLAVMPLYTDCYNDSLGDPDSALDTFYGHACDRLRLRRKDPYGLLRKSLYYYQVLHFTRVFGQVHVVTSEQFRADPTAVARETARFAGLCPFDFREPAAPVHVTIKNPRPDHFWSRDVYLRLRDWFRPYNARLLDILQTDEGKLGWRLDKEPTNFRTAPNVEQTSGRRLLVHSASPRLPRQHNGTAHRVGLHRRR